MKDTTGKNQRKRRERPAREDPELRIVGIDVKPAPDAQERLRRLFTILVGLAEDDLPLPGTDPSQDDGGEEERLWASPPTRKNQSNEPWRRR